MSQVRDKSRPNGNSRPRCDDIFVKVKNQDKYNSIMAKLFMMITLLWCTVMVYNTDYFSTTAFSFPVNVILLISRIYIRSHHQLLRKQKQQMIHPVWSTTKQKPFRMKAAIISILTFLSFSLGKNFRTSFFLKGWIILSPMKMIVMCNRIKVHGLRSI